MRHVSAYAERHDCLTTDNRAPTLAASSDEQVARAFVEAHALGGVFGRPSLEARSQLAVRCTHVAEALTLAIGRRHQWRWVQMAPSMTGIRAVWRLAHE